MSVSDSAEAGRIAIRQALGDASPSLSNILDASTLGTAIYDDNLRCVITNKVLASMNGTSRKAHVGKTIRESLGDDAAQVEPAFRQVWKTGKPLHDVELTVHLPGRSEKIHFVLNLYPFRDNPGDMRLIGVLFYEVTNKKKLQDLLRNMNGKAETVEPDSDNLFAGESGELTAHSIETLQQSIELLDCSMALRCQISEMRMVAALRRAAPFSEVPLDNLPLLILGESSFQDQVGAVAPASDSISSNELIGDSPSNREQQIMQLLVDGNSNKEVAGVLNLSIRTVENYRARLMVKLHLHSMAELVRYAVRNNLIKP